MASEVNLLSEIDKFMEIYSDANSEEISEKSNNNNLNDNCETRSEVDSNEINTANSVANNTSSLEQSEVQFIGQNPAVFELLEDNEECGVYEYNPYESNWNVFYKTHSPEEKKPIIKQELEPEIAGNYSVDSSINKSPNFIFQLNENLNDENEILSYPSVNLNHGAVHNNVFHEMCKEEQKPEPEIEPIPEFAGNYTVNSSINKSPNFIFKLNEEEQKPEPEIEPIPEFAGNYTVDSSINKSPNFIFKLNENSSNGKETTLSYPSVNFNQVQDRNFVGLCEKNMDINQNLSNPSITNNYHKVDNQDDTYRDEYYKSCWDNATNIKNNNWKPNYKPFRQNHEYNNYNQSDNWKKRKGNSFYSSSNPYKKKRFSKMYNNKQAKNFTSSTFIPKRHVNNFTTQPDNSQHFNNMNHCAQGNKFGHFTPFTKNNPRSSFRQFTSKNNDKPTFNYFKRPMFPSVSSNKSSHCLTEPYKNPQHSLTQPDSTQHNLFHKDTTRKESNSNSDLETPALSTLQTSPDGSKYKKCHLYTDKIIDKLPVTINECKDDDELTKQKTNTFNDVDYSVETGIQFKQHSIAKDKYLPNTDKIIDKMPTVRNKNNYDDESTKQKLISYDDIYNYFIESNDQINLHHIVIDYLSPVSLVGTTVKFVSRKMANTITRENILKALRLHGAAEYSWWTPDDMFYIQYADRINAKRVYEQYPKNTNSSY